jgi:O-antigen/teichoic acid export membrane protein
VAEVGSADPEALAGKVSARRLSTSVIDQALSTVTNLAITLIAAQTLGVDDFGRFGVAYVIASLAAGAIRSSIGATVLIFQDEATADGGQHPFGAAMAVGLVLGTAAAAAGAAIGGDFVTSMLALGAILPGVLVQDTGRLLEFAALRPGRALGLDIVWAIVMGLAVVILAVADAFSPATLLLAWGGAGTASALVTLVQHDRCIPRPSFRWIRRTWEFAWRYLLMFASTMGVFQMTTVLLGAISGVDAVGAVRATQVLFGPLQNLATGLLVTFVPETTAETRLRDYRSRVIVSSIALAGVAVVVTVIAVSVPRSLGTAVLGDAWIEARHLLLPAGLAAVMFGLTNGAVLGLRAARAAHESVVIGLKISAFQLVIPIAGAVIDDASGYQWALVATWVIGMVLWWSGYAAVESRQSAPSDAPP